MRLLTAKEASAVLRVSPARFYDLCRLQLVPCVRLGRQVRIEEGALREWIAQGGQAFPTAGEEALPVYRTNLKRTNKERYSNEQ